MTVCRKCGKEFKVSTARRSMGRKYGTGSYKDFCPDEDICHDCLQEEIKVISKDDLLEDEILFNPDEIWQYSGHSGDECL